MLIIPRIIASLDLKPITRRPFDKAAQKQQQIVHLPLESGRKKLFFLVDNNSLQSQCIIWEFHTKLAICYGGDTTINCNHCCCSFRNTKTLSSCFESSRTQSERHQKSCFDGGALMGRHRSFPLSVLLSALQSSNDGSQKCFFIL
jgi:hypothetical protein